MQWDIGTAVRSGRLIRDVRCEVMTRGWPICLSRGHARWIRKREGLTAFEVLIVAALLGTLSVLAVPSYFKVLKRSASKSAIGDVVALQFAIDTYERMNERLPDSLDDLGPGPRIDRWGNPYHYLPNTASNWQLDRRLDQHQVPLNDDYDLFSSGFDGEWKKPLMNAKSHDDIVRADNGLYIGIALDH